MSRAKYRKNIHYIEGNHTRIDPFEEIYPLYTTNSITQAPDTRNGTATPIPQLESVIEAKQAVDNMHL